VTIRLVEALEIVLQVQAEVKLGEVKAIAALCLAGKQAIHLVRLFSRTSSSMATAPACKRKKDE
jgi:hypothetical protein